MNNKLKIYKYLKEVLIDSQCSLDLLVNNFSFTIEPAENKLQIWIDGKIAYLFNSFNEFLNDFIIDGKPLIEQLDFIEFL